MSEVNVRNSLLAAEAAIKEGRYKDSLQHTKAALRGDKNSKEAWILVGTAAFHLKEYEQGEKAYRRALGSSPDLVAAWEGLAEIFAATDDVQGQIEANEHLVRLTTEEDSRDRIARGRLAEAYFRNGSYEEAIQQYRQLLRREPPSSTERCSILCSLADVMLKREKDVVAAKIKANSESDPSNDISNADDENPSSPENLSCLELDILAAQAEQDCQLGEDSLARVLQEIAEMAPPALKYLPYREQHLRRCLLRIFHAEPRTTERQLHRMEALRECVAMICRGGACSPLPYEAGVWLLEEEEELKGGQVPIGGQEVGGTQTLAGGVQAGAEGHIGSGRDATVAYAAENFSRRMLHQFPANPTAAVLLALMLRRHAMASHRPISQAQRRQIERLLFDAMKDDAHIDAASGFKALAELQYENRDYEEAIETALRGLRWLQQRRDRGHEALTQIALSLRLVWAKSLRRLGRLEEAERHFAALAGWVTEGEVAFAEMCGSAPTSIHQQALRGLALVALARGDIGAARAQYERILGKAALGRGPAEHWAHGDYGFLLYQDDDFAGARYHLEKAIHVAEEEGCAATDSQVGEHRYRLGEVYWKMKGRYRNEKQFAYTQFFEAAKVEGHAQAPALAALGRYYEMIEQPESAQRCFKKALSIDPTVDIAGNRRDSIESVGRAQ